MRWLLICSLALLPACQLFQQSDTIEEANAANGSGTVLHQSSEKPSESKLAEVIETELQEILDTGHRGINELPTERIETPIEQAIPNKQKESTLFQKVANLPKQVQKKTPI